MTQNSTGEMATGTDDVVDLTDAPPAEEVPAEEVPEQPEHPESEDEPDESTKAGREAAKYRRRLRETEAERNALTERVDSLRRSVAEQIAATSGMSKPEALWIGDVAVEDMLDADGNVDRDRVLAACDDVAARFGIRRRPRPNPAQLETPEDPPRSIADQMVGVVQGRRR